MRYVLQYELRLCGFERSRYSRPTSTASRYPEAAEARNQQCLQAENERLRLAAAAGFDQHTRVHTGMRPRPARGRRQQQRRTASVRGEVTVRFQVREVKTVKVQGRQSFQTAAFRVLSLSKLQGRRRFQLYYRLPTTGLPAPRCGVFMGRR